MSVRGVGDYRNTLYQWQSQQLKQNGSYSSSKTSSTAVDMLFGGTNSMSSQISSMVELTKYAMNAMGLSPDSRVTFSQINKYREQLQSEFNNGVKKGLEASGISDLSALSFTLDKAGKITAIGENAADRKTAQAWLDANPAYGEELLRNMPEDAFESFASIPFTISSTGKITVTNQAQQKLQASFNENVDIANNTRKALEEAGISVSWPLELDFDDNGGLVVKGDDEQAKAVNDWLKENKALENDIKRQLESQKVDASAVSLRLGKSGGVQASVNNATLNEAQAGLDNATETGKKLIQGLDNLGIDKNINFSIQIDENGVFKVISDHPDAAKMQKFFDDNPELVKKYRQIETLAGIDDARKAMQISPAAMRKRVQVESMAAWWSTSGSANSYFGQYSNSNLSLISGLNLNI